MTKKSLILISFLFLLAGCSLDDESQVDFTLELVPVMDADLPDTLYFGNEYRFQITYNRPTTCHYFEGYDYTKTKNERIIGVVNSVINEPPCDSLTDDLRIENLNFVVERDDFYIFKFWQGEDDEGAPIYLTKEVPVKIE
ncbi:hypothetical protein [Mesonia aquimarina]|uniref:hypothetical protein n=1 Tax=Mesonia aquimarina TaxID=1504967 RepID=UPI0013CE9608|nr:hypothetical protein [Mesonia aquimarina]